MEKAKHEKNNFATWFAKAKHEGSVDGACMKGACKTAGCMAGSASEEHALTLLLVSVIWHGGTVH